MRRILHYFWGPSDPRTYALVRIALALASLYNLLELWPVRYEYFASCGMISLPGLQVTAAGGLYTSIFYWVSSRAGVTMIFLVAAAATIALGAGVFMRLSAALVWAWNISYSDRVFPILHSWDALLRVYSLLVLVSPMGRIWSVAALRSPRVSDASPVPTYGLRLMRWQLFVVYVTTFWLKAPDEFWRNGQVCAYFSMSFYSRNPNSTWLARHEWVSAVQTYLSLVIEASVPWLLSMKKTRLWGFLAGFALHIGIAMTSILAVFSLCLLPGYLAFLDGDDIDRGLGLARRLAGVLPVYTRSSRMKS
jgi:vitamin K-dependent gamma-carboxylase-like protein